MAGLIFRGIVHVRYECVCENDSGQWVSVIFAYLCREPCHGHLCPRQFHRHRSAPVTKRREVRRSVTRQRRMAVEENRLELPA